MGELLFCSHCSYVNFINSADARRAIELFKGKQVGRNELLVVFTPLQQQIRSQQYVQKRLQSTQSTQPTNVYVSHIPRPFPFADALSQLGRIKCSNLNKLHEGVAFIDFETHQDAVAAINKLEGLLTPYSMHRIRARFAATLPVSQRTEKLREIVKDEIVQIVDKGTPYLDTSTLLEQQIMEMRECITVYEKNIAK